MQFTHILNRIFVKHFLTFVLIKIKFGDILIVDKTIQSFLESVLGSLGNADVSAIFQSIVETISGFIGSIGG